MGCLWIDAEKTELVGVADVKPMDLHFPLKLSLLNTKNQVVYPADYLLISRGIESTLVEGPKFSNPTALLFFVRSAPLARVDFMGFHQFSALILGLFYKL